MIRLARVQAHDKRSRSGFTLLEILLAVVLTGIVATVLYASLSIAFNARGAAIEEVARVHAARTAMDLIRGDLEGVLRPTGILAAALVGESVADVNGRPADELTYVTTNAALPAGEPMGDLVNVTLRLIDDDPDEYGAKDSVRLLVRQMRTNLLSPVELEPVTQVIARRVLSFNIRYYDGSEWQDQWDTAQQNDMLPTLVELTLELLPEGIDERDPKIDAKSISVRRLVQPTIAPTAAEQRAFASGGAAR